MNDNQGLALQASASTTSDWKCATSRSDSGISRPSSMSPDRTPACTRSTRARSSATWVSKARTPRSTLRRRLRRRSSRGTGASARARAGGWVRSRSSGARHHVDHRARKEEVELAALDLARGVVATPLFRPGRALLRHPAALQLEEIRVRRHVHDRREPRVSDGAVVALEEVLGRDLPVRGELRFGPLEEAQESRSIPASAIRSGASPRNSSSGATSTSGLTNTSGLGVEPQLKEPELLVVGPTLAREPGRGHELAVEPMSTRGTLKGCALAGPFAHERAAMAADVQERACPPRRAPARRGRRRRASRRTTRCLRPRPVGRRTATSDGRCALLELQDGRIHVPAPGKSLRLDRAHGAERYPSAATIAPDDRAGSSLGRRDRGCGRGGRGRDARPARAARGGADDPVGNEELGQEIVELAYRDLIGLEPIDIAMDARHFGPTGWHPRSRGRLGNGTWSRTGPPSAAAAIRSS